MNNVIQQYNRYKIDHTNDIGLKTQFAESKGYIIEIRRSKSTCAKEYIDSYISTIHHVTNQGVQGMWNRSSRNSAFNPAWESFIKYYNRELM